MDPKMSAAIRRIYMKHMVQGQFIEAQEFMGKIRMMREMMNKDASKTNKDTERQKISGGNTLDNE